MLSDAEVDSLDALGIPVCFTSLQLSGLTKRLGAAYHEYIVVCTVCDEFCILSKSISVEAVNLPLCFFFCACSPFR